MARSSRSDSETAQGMAAVSCHASPGGPNAARAVLAAGSDVR
jgi:hypothetical protein